MRTPLYSRRAARVLLALAPLALSSTGAAAQTCPESAGDCEPGGFEPVPLYAVPRVSVAPMHPGYADHAAGSVTAAYTTPAYVSLDEPRALRLVYASGLADPRVLVQADATDTTTTNPPAAMSIRVRGAATGAWQTFTSGRQENVYTAGAGTTRLSAQLDASGLASGAYDYDVVVRSHFADGSVREAPAVRVRALVVNERASPYGAGWIVAGVQRLVPQAGGVVVLEGDGSARWFTDPGSCVAGYQGDSPWCSYTSPEGDFSRLARNTATGGYARHYPDRTLVEFSAGGWMTAVTAQGTKTTFAYDAAGRLATVTDPAGLAIRLAYDAAGKLASVRDHSGRRVDVRIGTAGVVDSICDPVSCALRAGYDAASRMTWELDRANSGTH